jgi:hypothetical protein
MRFPTADTHYREAGLPAERAARRQRLLILTSAFAPKDVVAVVRANHGRWIVDCPFCRGAQLASPTDRRFLCADCGNVNVGGKWLRVIWPADPAAIEAALLVRPLENRNWWPGESPSDLRRENRAHDIPEAVA